MKQILLILAVVVIVVGGCGGDPNKKANELFVEAVQLISSAEEQTGEAAIKDYEQALAHLQNIISDYSESDLAVKLISGETLFTGKSLKEIKERVKELKRDAAESAVAATAPPPEKSVKQRFLDGELTEADLEKVTELNLSGTQITDAGLKEVAKCTQLTFLNLGGTKITDAGLKEVAKLKQLKTLHLTETQITDAGLKEVAKLQQLTSLGLVGTKITDVGLKEVAKLQKLEVLYLTYCKITDEGLKEVAKLQKLTELDLFATQVTPVGEADLQKALPKCEIQSNFD